MDSISAVPDTLLHVAAAAATQYYIRQYRPVGGAILSYQPVMLCIHTLSSVTPLQVPLSHATEKTYWLNR